MPYVDPYGGQGGWERTGRTIATMISQMAAVKQRRKHETLSQAAIRARHSGDISEFLHTAEGEGMSPADIQREAQRFGISDAIEGGMARQIAPQMQPTGLERGPLAQPSVEPPTVEELTAVTRTPRARAVPEPGTTFYAGATAEAPRAPEVQRQMPLPSIPEVETREQPRAFELGGGGVAPVPLPTTAEGLQVRSLHEAVRAGKRAPGTLEAFYTPIDAQQAIQAQINMMPGTPEEKQVALNRLVEQYQARTYGEIDPKTITLDQPTDPQLLASGRAFVQEYPPEHRGAAADLFMETHGLDLEHKNMLTARMYKEPTIYEVSGFLQMFGDTATPEQRTEFADTGVVPRELVEEWYAKKGARQTLTAPQLFTAYAGLPPEDFQQVFEWWSRNEGQVPPPSMAVPTFMPEGGAARLSASLLKQLYEAVTHLPPERIPEAFQMPEKEWAQLPQEERAAAEAQFQEAFTTAFLEGRAPATLLRDVATAQYNVRLVRDAIQEALDAYVEGDNRQAKRAIKVLRPMLSKTAQDSLDKLKNVKKMVEYLAGLQQTFDPVVTTLSGQQELSQEGQRKSAIGRS